MMISGNFLAMGFWLGYFDVFSIALLLICIRYGLVFHHQIGFGGLIVCMLYC